MDLKRDNGQIHFFPADKKLKPLSSSYLDVTLFKFALPLFNL